MTEVTPDARARAGETKKRRTREKLMHAADGLMREQGMAATVEAIAERAGVSVPTFYNFYHSRNDLCAHALDALVFDEVERADRPDFVATVNKFLELCEDRRWLLVAALAYQLEEGVPREQRVEVAREGTVTMTHVGPKLLHPIPRLLGLLYQDDDIDILKRIESGDEFAQRGVVALYMAASWILDAIAGDSAFMISAETMNDIVRLACGLGPRA